MRLLFRCDNIPYAWTADALEAEADRLIHTHWRQLCKGSRDQRTRARKRRKRTDLAMCVCLCLATARRMRKHGAPTFADLREKDWARAKNEADEMFRRIHDGDLKVEDLTTDTRSS